MKRVLVCLLAIFSFALASGAPVSAHCQIPCGIYDDELRMNLIEEHIGTIEKSMNLVIELGKAKETDYNQIVRWVNNKDQHADELSEIVTYYFMTQRVKPEDKQYDKRIAILHQMLIAAMKCKQTTDLKNVENLRTLAKEFRALYFSK
ncbi:MAG TPA: superoxide dismutase [Ni] [Candidatus Ozemobacteraceae bacterium]|nr:superoxide dismutase [Ni] [Candidatus Ozemobacteraceae bacterium]HQG28318.1 superoxide dismutase [Ni] [Candidatus Ozemobacteraceae bacterium]